MKFHGIKEATIPSIMMHSLEILSDRQRFWSVSRSRAYRLTFQRRLLQVVRLFVHECHNATICRQQKEFQTEGGQDGGQRMSNEPETLWQ